jgi:hypothetical protein
MRLAVAASLVVLLASVAARSELVPCRRPADVVRIAAALERIRGSVDPCGQSPEIVALLDRLGRCSRVRYEICTDPHAARNVFEHADHADEPGRIVWNPELRSELERGCDGDLARPLLRDPTASLLHEIAHAVHDCEGLNAGAFEGDAVRIENVYRRAAGLCQRTRYGDETLSAASCDAGTCRCPGLVPAPSAATGVDAADSAR